MDDDEQQEESLSPNTTVDAVPLPLISEDRQEEPHSTPFGSELQSILGIGLLETHRWEDHVDLNDMDDGTSSVASYDDQDKRTSSLFSSWLNRTRSSTSSLRTSTLSTPGTLTPTASNYSLATPSIQGNLHMTPMMDKVTTELDQPVEQRPFLA